MELSRFMQYALGVEAAWRDLRIPAGREQVAALLGLGLWRGLPRTTLFFRGYAAVIDLPPARRWQFVIAVRTTRLRGSRPVHGGRDSSS